MADKIINPRIEFQTAQRATLSWETEDARFHVWLNGKTGDPETEYGTNYSIIYKNPPLGIKYREPGHWGWGTRKLKSTVPKNAKLVQDLLSQCDFEAARAEFIAKEKSEEAEREAEYAREVAKQRIKDAAPDMLAVLEQCVAFLNGPDDTPIRPGSLLSLEIKKVVAKAKGRE